MVRRVQPTGGDSAGIGRLMVRAESHVANVDKTRRAATLSDGKPTAEMPVTVSNAVTRNLDEVVDICQAIVRYVHRTGERVILDRANQEGEFIDSPEVQALQLRSVLCLPVIRQSKMSGILYLENRLADGAFTVEKTRLAELMMVQAAILIENARLTAELVRVTESEGDVKAV